MGIGNDIVDLLAPEAGNKHLDQRYAGRVFTSRELDAMKNSQKPGPLFWAIWACKEAAYKALSQDHPGVSSWPKKYDVDLQTAGGKGAGMVKTPKGEVFVRVDFFEEFVHAVAATNRNDLDVVIFSVAESMPGDGKSCMHSHAKHGNEQDGAAGVFRKRHGSDGRCRGRVSLPISDVGCIEPVKPNKQLPSGLKSISVLAQEQRKAGLGNPACDLPNGSVGWVELRETQQADLDNPPDMHEPPQERLRGRVSLPNGRFLAPDEDHIHVGAHTPSPLTGEGRGGGDDKINPCLNESPMTPSSSRTRGPSVLPSFPCCAWECILMEPEDRLSVVGLEPAKPDKQLLSGLKSISVLAQEQRKAGLVNPACDLPNGSVGWVELRETQQADLDNPPDMHEPPQERLRGRVFLPNGRFLAPDEDHIHVGAHTPSPLTGEGRGGGDDKINPCLNESPMAPSSSRTRGPSLLFASGQGRSFNECDPPHPVLPPPGGKGRRPVGFGSNMLLRRELAPASYDDAAAENFEAEVTPVQEGKFRMHSHAKHGNENAATESSEEEGCAAQDGKSCMHSHAKHGNENPGGLFDPGGCETPSALVRRLALQHLSCFYGLDDSALRIVRKKRGGKLGPPLVQCGDADLPVSLSLSHDGPYLAWAFLINSDQRLCDTAQPD